MHGHSNKEPNSVRVVFFCCLPVSLVASGTDQLGAADPQPYRTTPLVLPGAKVGRDTATTTQSYLALQTTQNPMLWHAPGSAPVAHPAGASDVVIKQKVRRAVR